MNTLGEAVSFAAAAHATQTDKSGDPYILHPLRIMMRVRAAYPHRETYQVVALLHDVVEDTEITMEEITSKFHFIVAGGVDAITRRYEGETPLETYRDYIVRCCKDPIARVVKRFDVYDNMDPKRWHPDVPYKRYLWTLRYLKELDDIDHARAEHGVFS